MPKSKRAKLVQLSKVKRKGPLVKHKLVETVQDLINTHRNVVVIEPENMRNDKLKELRIQWKPSRFLFGKNKVIAIALGRNEQEAFKPKLDRVAQQLHGTRGLLFTDSSKDEIMKFFSSYEAPQYPRGGFCATETFDLAAGPLQLPFSTEPYLRQLGLPTRLHEGKIELLSATRVCKKGDVLTPEQCKILHLFEVQMATFRLHPLCIWSDGVFTELEQPLTSGGERKAQIIERRGARGNSAVSMDDDAADEDEDEEEEDDEEEEEEEEEDGAAAMRTESSDVKRAASANPPAAPRGQGRAAAGAAPARAKPKPKIAASSSNFQSAAAPSGLLFDSMSIVPPASGPKPHKPKAKSGKAGR